MCPMKSAPVMLTLSDSKHVVLPVDDDSDLNVVASFDRRGEYIYTGNAKGKVSYEVGGKAGRLPWLLFTLSALSFCYPWNGLSPEM